MTKFKLIPGKLYKHNRKIPSGYHFHIEGEEPSENNKVIEHSFLLYLENKYHKLTDQWEHFFLDTNGNRVALWSRPKTFLLRYFEEIRGENKK